MVGKARILKDAPTIFIRRENRRRRPDVPLPKEVLEYYDTLNELAGKTFVIDREYGHRIVLKYPPELCHQMKDGKGNVCGIDLEQDLVEKV